MTTTTKPNITVDDVRTVALQLMEENGTTSNLEIKEELRRQGFWAEQHEVSTMMDEVQNDPEIEWAFNGTYREYWIVEEDEDDGDGAVLPLPFQLPDDDSDDD